MKTDAAVGKRSTLPWNPAAVWRSSASRSAARAQDVDAGRAASLRRTLRTASILTVLGVTPALGATPARAQVGVPEAEAEDGFELLFDGESLDGWRGFRMEDVPAGWRATDGVLAFTPGVGGGTLITRDTFTDFDLRLEWRVGPAGNSGIFFGVSEATERAYESGPEMQVLDDAGHPDGVSPLTSAGSNYGLHAPAEDVTRPAGQWNEARIVRRGSHVEHWLNGVRIVQYAIGSPEWEVLVAGSKFVQWPDYGRHRDGHIGLQDHGDPVAFRNIRIRRLGGDGSG